MQDILCKGKLFHFLAHGSSREMSNKAMLASLEQDRIMFEHAPFYSLLVPFYAGCKTMC